MLTGGFGPGPESRWPPPTVPPQAGPTNPGPTLDTRPNSIMGSKFPNLITLSLKSMDPLKPVWESLTTFTKMELYGTILLVITPNLMSVRIPINFWTFRASLKAKGSDMVIPEPPEELE